LLLPPPLLCACWFSLSVLEIAKSCGPKDRVLHHQVISSSIFNSINLLSIFYLIKVLCHTILAAVLGPCLSRQIVDDFPNKSDIRHGVEDVSDRNVFAVPHGLTVQANLNFVWNFTLQKPYSH
jgi:hypothetical protein